MIGQKDVLGTIMRNLLTSSNWRKKLCFGMNTLVATETPSAHGVEGFLMVISRGDFKDPM